MQEPGSAPLVGRTVGGFCLERKIGQGGMGVVYLGVRGAARAAVKVLPDLLRGDPQHARRFLREIEVAGAVVHPNVVRLLSAGEEHGLLYMAMEFVPGRNLQEELETGRILPIDEAIDVARQAALGLAAIHAAGLVHRDVKPANLLRTAAGEVKVADLGLVRGDALSRLSYSGQILGTPHYMSPEQALSRPGVDHRADVYALGATLYHLVAGRPPFTGDNPLPILQAHVTRDPLPLPTLRPEAPAALWAVARKMMAKSPDDRHPDMAAVASALRGVSASRPRSSPSARPISTVRLAQRPSRAGRLASAALAAVLAGAVLAGIARSKEGDGDPPAARSEAIASPAPPAPEPFAPSTDDRGPRDGVLELRRSIDGLPARERLARVDAWRAERPGMEPVELARLRSECLEAIRGEAVEEVDRAAGRAGAAGSHAEAIAAFDAVSARDWPAELRGEVERRLAAARDSFRAGISAALDEAAAAALAGDSDRAGRILAGLDRAAGGEWEGRRLEIEAARQAAAEARALADRAAAARLEFDAGLEDARRLRGARDLAGALAAFERLAAEPRFEAFAGECSAEVGAVRAVARVEAAFLSGLDAAMAAGTTVVLNGSRGRIVAVRDGTVRLEVEGQELGFDHDRIAPEDRVRIARLVAGRGPEARLDAGLFLLFHARGDAARTELEAALAGGVEAARPYLGPGEGEAGPAEQRPSRESFHARRVEGGGYRYAFEDRAELADFALAGIWPAVGSPEGSGVSLERGVLTVRNARLELDRTFETPVEIRFEVRCPDRRSWSVATEAWTWWGRSAAGLTGVDAPGGPGSAGAPIAGDAYDGWRAVAIRVEPERLRIAAGDVMRPIDVEPGAAREVRLAFECQSGRLEVRRLTVSRPPALERWAAREARLEALGAAARALDPLRLEGAALLDRSKARLGDWQVAGGWVVGRRTAAMPCLKFEEPSSNYVLRFRYQADPAGSLLAAVHQQSGAEHEFALPTLPGEHAVEARFLHGLERLTVDGLPVRTRWHLSERGPVASRGSLRFLATAGGEFRLGALEVVPLVDPAGVPIRIGFGEDEAWSPRPAEWIPDGATVRGSGLDAVLVSRAAWEDLDLSGEVLVESGEVRIGCRDAYDHHFRRTSRAELAIPAAPGWRRFLLRAQGPAIRGWIDGREVEVARQGDPARGNLRLHVAGGAASFRGLVLVPGG